MRFQTTQELLEKTKQFHSMASDFYLDLGRELEQRRISMLLEYLMKHEKKLADNMAKYQLNARPDLLKTWFDEAPDIELGKALQNLEIHNPLTVEDVVQVGMHLGDYLIWAYESLAEQAETGEVKQAFENLANMAKADKRSLSIDLQGMQDL